MIDFRETDMARHEQLRNELRTEKMLVDCEYDPHSHTIYKVISRGPKARDEGQVNLSLAAKQYLDRCLYNGMKVVLVIDETYEKYIYTHRGWALSVPGERTTTHYSILLSRLTPVPTKTSPT